MQGSAADIQAATTAALLRALLTRPDKIKMINEVHDSKWFYVRTDCLDDVLPWLRSTIENVPKIFRARFNIDVPFNFPVDIEVGKNFAEMDKYNDSK
jgi:DNA polymerase I-like protein with 3'-5' exonuclease and polymerase domains